MKVILVGAGVVARELLRRLSEVWEITVVDTSVERLDGLQTARAFHAVCGDGSSRLVLARAGLEQADALLATTGDDDVNLEACRLARGAGVHRLAALVRDTDRQEEYRRLAVPVISEASLAARRLESHLERRRISSFSFADGRAEAIEFRVTPDSPVCGRSLGELHARSFIVGAILRESQLIVPHGDTVLEPDDLVTVVGAGTDFAEIVRMFTSGESRFPLEYGKRVVVAVEDEASLNGTFSEAVAIARNSRATSILQVHRDPTTIKDETRAADLRGLVRRAEHLGEGINVHPRPVASSVARALEAIPGKESVGLIVLRAPERKGFRALARIAGAIALACRTGRPVLLSRGTHPYRRILVPGRDTPSARAAIRAGIDLASSAKGVLETLAVLDPVFLADLDREEDGRGVLSWIEEEAAVHGVEVEGKIVRGNPVRMLQRHGESSDLVVLGVRRRRRRVTLRYGIAELVARRVTRSVLFVPVRDTA